MLPAPGNHVLVRPGRHIVASGIYRSAEPPFDGTLPMWRYKFTALSGTEQKMFV